MKRNEERMYLTGVKSESEPEFNNFKESVKATVQPKK
jgi:hypothetical protein